MPFAHAEDGARLYFEESGAGEPLLLIAGRNNDHHVWNLVRGDFSKRYRVIVYDARGTGQSDKPEQPAYTTRGFARDAVAILDHLGLPRAHVYGISMGGAIGQWVGIDHGDRVGALVLACSSPGVTHGVRRSEEVHALIAQADPAKVMDLFFAHKRALPKFYLSMRESAKNPMPKYAERLHGDASEKHNTWDHLPTIKRPTLVIHGSDDEVVPLENANLLAKRIPGAELYVVRGGRHMFFIEFRGEVDRVVSKFLARHPLGG
ncbi:MAG: alpha/beta hydrolase [Chloroflexi bacterium]|nr:alpha/beta hydrolase [Chloroflexota bacterium]